MICSTEINLMSKVKSSYELEKEYMDLINQSSPELWGNNGRDLDQESIIHH